MLANNLSTSTCFVIFELIKFMFFRSTLIFLHEEFLIPHPQQVQPVPALQQVQPTHTQMRVYRTPALKVLKYY